MSESRSLAKSLGIDGNRLRRLRDNDGGELFLTWIQYEKKSRKNVKDSVIQYLKRQYAVTGRTPLQLLSTWQDYHNMPKRLKRDILHFYQKQTSRKRRFIPWSLNRTVGDRQNADFEQTVWIMSV